MRHHLRIVHGSPTSVELAAVTAVLSALALGGHAPGHSHRRDHRPRRAHWDLHWNPHPVPHSWCARGARAPFPGR
ncbi:acyl-CoA carboxylase subunit epsilon [Streptomyces fradiae]|uniref:acyl-CoA carboxylase subunit epsilon n=1 Tax=Streptomyces fradiae TaxID=1906 RepID=UPI0024B637CF|nr:acyl-CoA carboxylase subunit epsilon [Streptomyces fradiae]